jgi:hypothetical protein
VAHVIGLERLDLAFPQTSTPAQALNGQRRSGLLPSGTRSVAGSDRNPPPSKVAAVGPGHGSHRAAQPEDRAHHRKGLEVSRLGGSQPRPAAANIGSGAAAPIQRRSNRPPTASPAGRGNALRPDGAAAAPRTDTYPPAQALANGHGRPATPSPAGSGQ